MFLYILRDSMPAISETTSVKTLVDTPFVVQHVHNALRSSCACDNEHGTDWGIQDAFTWLLPGQSCRYLDSQVGLNITPAQQFEPVLASIRRKLCHWSQAHLSLAGRALVVNQVLLATAWYVAACWMLHDRVIGQLRRLNSQFSLVRI